MINPSYIEPIIDVGQSNTANLASTITPTKTPASASTTTATLSISSSNIIINNSQQNQRSRQQSIRQMANVDSARTNQQQQQQSGYVQFDTLNQSTNKINNDKGKLYL